MNARAAALVLFTFVSSCTGLRPRPSEVEPWFPAVNDAGDPVFAVFEGRVPCSDMDPLSCDKVKVALVLYQDPNSGALTTYALARVYVGDTPEGRQERTEGAVAVTLGTHLDPGATVYELDSSTPLDFRLLWAIGDDLLFILDQHRQPKVGNASWSYVLNRTQ